jgi:hypothetical protein
MDATVFIPLIIIALVQLVKYIVPNINGAVTILIAMAVGLLVGFFDQFIGVTDVSPAAGIALGLGAVGITTVAQKLGVFPTPEKR